MAETVRINRMSDGMGGIGKLQDGMTVFVKEAVIGDTCTLKGVDRKPRYATAHVDEIVESSAYRVNCDCALHTECGGCPWMGISYDAQLALKRQGVVGALVHAGKFDERRAQELVENVQGSKRETGFRNKIELAASTDDAGRLSLGFHAEQSDKIVFSKNCPAASKNIQNAPKQISGALRIALGEQDCGIFRVGVRSSLRTKSTEIALWTPPGPFPRNRVASILGQACKASSIVRVLADPGKARKVKKVEVLSGKGFWEEELCDTRYMVSAPSFFQVNTAQAENMVQTALAYFGNLEGSYVADLYSGVGTFSIPLAKAGAEVTAVEYAGSSVRDLRRNADAAGVFIDVVGGDAARELEEIDGIDALIVDPPRAGLAQGVPQSIVDTGCSQMVYVSCNAQTWARDAAVLEELGFKLTSVKPFDLFPQTHHCEVVSYFTR